MVRRIPKLIMIIFIASVMVLGLLILINLGSGKTITVDDDGGADYTKIQDAINASENGDTIRVNEGIYYENVLIKKSLTLIGNGSFNTIIDGQNMNQDVVRIRADHVNISGFSILNSGNKYVAGVNIKSDHNRIYDNNCSNNNYGIYFADAHFNTLLNNSLTSNNENGIRIESSDHNNLSNNTCELNKKDGLVISSSTNVTMTGNRFIEESIGLRGNSILHWNSHMVDVSNTVNAKPVMYYKNTRGGVIPKGAGQIILANCSLMEIRNQQINFGGNRILLGFSNNNIVMNNDVSSNGGTGIYLDENSCNNTINDNNCSGNDNGIEIDVNGGLKIPNNGGLKFPTLNMSFSIVVMEVLNVIDGGTIHDTTPEQQGIKH